MNTYREEFINKLESLIGQEVKSIEWIYGLGENVSDSEEELYYFDVCLQVRLYDDGQGFISLNVDSYCEDRSDCIGSMLQALDAGLLDRVTVKRTRTPRVLTFDNLDSMREFTCT